MPRFAYHFFHASDDPVRQAERFVAAVKPHGLLPGDNLVMDLEATRSDGSNDGVSASVVAERARTFLHTANGLAPNHRVLVYTNPGFAGTGACAGLDPWYLWVAHYGVSSPDGAEALVALDVLAVHRLAGGHRPFQRHRGAAAQLHPHAQVPVGQPSRAHPQRGRRWREAPRPSVTHHDRSPRAHPRRGRL